MEKLLLRRASIRSSIGDRSCASSTITWPYSRGVPRATTSTSSSSLVEQRKVRSGPPPIRGATRPRAKHQFPFRGPQDAVGALRKHARVRQHLANDGRRADGGKETIDRSAKCGIPAQGAKEVLLIHGYAVSSVGVALIHRVGKPFAGTPCDPAPWSWRPSWTRVAAG
jgi:hypothetical protein